MISPATVAAIAIASLAGVLAACGGSGGSEGGTTPTDGQSGPLADPPVIGAAAVTGADAIEIDNYTLVSSTRISRTVYDYTYTADLSNWSEADAAFTATLASSAASTTVMEASLTFGDVVRGATEVSTDTFTIRQDRSQPFNENALTWTVQAVPLALTTYELIDKALADGLINAETALVYKVFYEFHDDRLPAEYRGRADGFPEATAFQVAVDSFDSLPQPTQSILRPFLLPPDDPGSWYQLSLDQPQVLARALAHVASAEAMGNPSAAAVGPVEDVPGGLKRVLVAGKVYVYWHDQRYPQDAAVAFRVIDAIDQTIWPKLTALLGEPPYDASGILQVRIVNTASMAIVYQQITGGTLPPNTLGLAGPACHPNIPVVYLNRDDTQDIVQTAAHEITHAILARFPLSHGCSDRFWLGEATATWAEHYVYPAENTEHKEAPAFLDKPESSLETTGDHHEYGAYLWFLYVTRGDATGPPPSALAQRVTQTWAALASNDSLGAINAASGGGLKDKWPEFALYNWNRKEKHRTITLSVPPTTRISGEPYVYYGQWDGLIHKARESTSTAPPGGFQAPKKITLDGKIYKGYPLAHKINHLGAQYWHFDFTDDPKIRRVRLLHPYSNGSQPTAKVQVIVKKRDKDWMPAEDWTGYERKTLCRDKTADENFDELVVVISDSEFNDRNHVLDDGGTNPQNVHTFMEVSALGCTNWIGEVDFTADATVDGIHMTETNKATGVRWEIRPGEDRFAAQNFELVEGTVNWRHSASGSHDDGDSCTGDSRGNYDLAGSTAGQFGGEFSAIFNSVPPLIPLYNMFGYRTGVPGPADYLCTDAQEPFGLYFESPIYGTHDFWLDFGSRFISPSSPGLYESDPGGIGDFVSGSSIIRQTPKTRTYTWTFRKDPDPATRHMGFENEPEL